MPFDPFYDSNAPGLRGHIDESARELFQRQTDFLKALAATSLSAHIL